MTKKFLPKLFKILRLILVGSPSRNLMDVDVDAFSSSQMGSKLWLTERLEECLSRLEAPVAGYKIWIYAGWYGITNLIIRTRGVIPVEYVRCIDRDPTCAPIADRINKFWEWQDWQFKSLTGDVNEVNYSQDNPHIVINTSIEHMGPGPWFDMIPKGTIVAVQGSDLPHDDHVRRINSVGELRSACPMSSELYSGSIAFNYPGLELKRYMIIGIK